MVFCVKIACSISPTWGRSHTCGALHVREMLHATIHKIINQDIGHLFWNLVDFSISFVSILFAAHVNIQVKEGSIKIILKINNDHYFVSELYIFLHYQFFWFLKYI